MSELIDSPPSPKPMLGPAAAPDEGLFTPAFVKLLWVQMLFGLSYSSFLLLPKFLKVELHATASEIGRVMGAAPIAAAVVAPFIGGWAQRWSRVTILRVALAAEAVGAVGFALSDGVGLHTFVFRVLQGTAWVAVFNITATMAADLVSERRMAQAIGYLGVAMLATNAVAPGVAEPLASHYGFTPVYAGAGILVSLAFFAIQGMARAPELDLSRVTGNPAAPTSFRVFTVHYGSFLLGIGIGTMFTYLQPFALELGARVVGIFFVGYVGAAVFVRTVLARLTDRIGPARVTVAALTLYALTVGGTAWLGPNGLWLVGIGLGVSHGFGYPALTATGFRCVGKESRGRFMSWYTFSFNIGYAFTALFLGPFVDQYGYAAVFLGNGVLILSGAMLLAVMHLGRPLPVA